MSIKDYQATPEQLANVKKHDADRKALCDLINAAWKSREKERFVLTPKPKKEQNNGIV